MGKIDMPKPERPSSEEIAAAYYGKYGSVERDPQRKEIVAVYRETPDGLKVSWMAHIIRPERGRPYTGQFEPFPGRMESGRFLGFYPVVQ